MHTNPAVWISLLGSILTLASVSGMALTEGTIQAIMGVATIAIPLVIGVVIRSNVYSPQSAQTLLNLPQGISMGMADRVLAADVKISPIDTVSDVKAKVAEKEKL